MHTRPARTGLFSNVHSLEKRMGNENDEEGEIVLHTLLIVDDEEIEREGIAQFILDHGRLEDQ